MSKILVTGATGDIGNKTIKHLLKTHPSSDIVGLVRNPAKAQDLVELGVELRQGDYMEPTSLSEAFSGIDKLMLTSAHAFTDRKTAQGNVIDAAVRVGVGHLVYMSIARKQHSTVSMKEITEEDLFTEQKLLASGLDHTIVYHPPFLDVLSFYIGSHAQQTGIRVPAGNGKFAAACRDDLAAAHAAILTGEEHRNKTYSLTADTAISFSDIALILSSLTGKEVPYVPVSDEEYIANIGAGVPEFVAQFALGWVVNMNAGEWERTTSDLEALIGRKPMSAREFFRDHYLPSAPGKGA